MTRQSLTSSLAIANMKLSAHYPIVWRTRAPLWLALAGGATILAIVATALFDPKPYFVPPLETWLYIWSVILFTAQVAIGIDIARRTRVVHTLPQLLRLWGCVLVSLAALTLPFSILARGLPQKLATVSYSEDDSRNYAHTKAGVEEAQQHIRGERTDLHVPTAMSRPGVAFLVAALLAAAVTAWCALGAERIRLTIAIAGLSAFRSLRGLATPNLIDAKRWPTAWAALGMGRLATVMAVGVAFTLVQMSASPGWQTGAALALSAACLIALALQEEGLGYLTATPGHEVKVFLMQASIASTVSAGPLYMARYLTGADVVETTLGAAASAGLMVACVLTAAHVTSTMLALVSAVALGLVLAVSSGMIGAYLNERWGPRYDLGTFALSTCTATLLFVLAVTFQARAPIRKTAFNSLLYVAPMLGWGISAQAMLDYFSGSRNPNHDPQYHYGLLGATLAVLMPLLVLRFTYHVRNSIGFRT